MREATKVSTYNETSLHLWYDTDCHQLCTTPRAQQCYVHYKVKYGKWCSMRRRVVCTSIELQVHEGEGWRRSRSTVPCRSIGSAWGGGGEILLQVQPSFGALLPTPGSASFSSAFQNLLLVRGGWLANCSQSIICQVLPHEITPHQLWCSLTDVLWNWAPSDHLTEANIC